MSENYTVIKGMADEILILSSRIAQLEADKSNAEYCFRELKKINEQLETELEEVRKDQARYQYMRKLNVPQFHKIFMLNLSSDIRFDECIDAAIAAKESSK